MSAEDGIQQRAEIFEEIKLESKDNPNGKESEENGGEATRKENEKTGNDSKYTEFLETNRELFERLGFKDISDDPIFKITEEAQVKGNTSLCETCNKKITRLFSSCKFCKFCGSTLCDKCSSLTRKFKFTNEMKLLTICQSCENKFVNLELHQTFKEQLLQKEFEISELNSKYEKNSLIYSEQLDQINLLSEQLLKKKRENETKEEMLQLETNNLKERVNEACNMSEMTTKKINDSILFLKSLEEKKLLKEKEMVDVQKEREEITYEFEKRQKCLDEVLQKINHVSISLKNMEQKEGIELKDVYQQDSKATGHRQLDMLLKAKSKVQYEASKEETVEGMNEETMIIINPSKEIHEVYRESLLEKREEEDGAGKGRFKSVIMFLGKKIFDN